MKETWDNMTNEQLVALYQQTKDNSLFEYFLSRNIGLVYDYIGPIAAHYPEQRDELEQRGRVAVWRAMCRYREDMGCKFTTYLYYFFKDEMWEQWNEQRTIRIPINMLPHIDKLREKVPYGAFDVDSLEKPITCSDGEASDRDNVLSDVIAADDPSPLDIAIQSEKIETILKLTEHLKPREASCVRMYYGLGGYKPHTLQQIGDKYGVTRERIRQILEKALRRLRYFYIKEGIKRDYYDED